MAAQAPVAGALVLRAGFKDIAVGSFFRDATIKEGENLHESGHVFDVSERFATASSVLTAKCVRQACVTQEAYSIAIEVSCHSFMLRILLVHAHYPCTCKMLRTFRIIDGSMASRCGNFGEWQGGVVICSRLRVMSIRSPEYFA